MGFVTGEDATEVAPPPTVCTHKCQAQNQVKGRSTILGHPATTAVRTLAVQPGPAAPAAAPSPNPRLLTIAESARINTSEMWSEPLKAE